MNEVSPHTATHRHAARSQTRSNGTRIAAAHHTHQTQEPHTQQSGNRTDYETREEQACENRITDEEATDTQTTDGA